MNKSPEPLQRSSKLLARLSLSIAVLLAAAPAAKAGPLDHWQVRAPLPTGDSLGDVVYGNGAFVAVGSGSARSGPGTVLMSTNGVVWVANSVAGAPYAAAYGAGRFVAVGGYGAILISTNGLDWSDRSIGGCG